MTPEEFLKQRDALRELSAVMGPVYELTAQIKREFMEQGTLGSDAADELVVAILKMYVFNPESVVEAS